MIELTRCIGRNAPDLISTLAASGVIPSIEEFVANSYDADATEVRLNYDPQLRTLNIVDKGRGMSIEDGLPDFYRLGDSQKLENRLTPSGRRTIGKFGIATILLKYLANSYTLSTVHGETLTTVEEDFGGTELSADNPISYNVSSANGLEEGTSISMKELNFGEETNFDLAELRRRLSWDMPLLPDFRIFLNDEEIESASIDSAREYEFDKVGKDMGHIIGEVYITKVASKNSGMHVYVNGRRVGDPSSFFGNSSTVLRSKVVGIIHADDLEDAILFDRGRFREDDPGFIELSENLKKVLSKVDRDLYDRTKSGRLTNASSNVRNSVFSLEQKLGETFEEIAPEEGFKLLFGDRSLALHQDSSSISYSHVNGELFIDDSLPGVDISDRFSKDRFNSHLEHYVSEALACGGLLRNGKKIKGQKAFEDRMKILGRLNSKDGRISLSSFETTADPRQSIHPMRVYSLNEVANLTGVSFGSVNNLIKNGVLQQGERGIRGEHVVESLKLTEGKTSLYDIVLDTRGKQNIIINHNNASEQINRFFEKDLRFIENIGSQKNPCFFIRSSFADLLAESLDNKCLDGRKIQESNPLRKLEETDVTTSEGAKILGKEISEIAKILDYAKRLELPLRKRRIGRGWKFNLLDLEDAALAMKNGR